MYSRTWNAGFSPAHRSIFLLPRSGPESTGRGSAVSAPQEPRRDDRAPSPDRDQALPAPTASRNRLKELATVRHHSGQRSKRVAKMVVRSGLRCRCCFKLKHKCARKNQVALRPPPKSCRRQYISTCLYHYVSKLQPLRPPRSY